MTIKVGFVHTGSAIAELFKPMIAETLEGVSAFHIVDDSLIQDLLAEGKFTPGITKRLCNQVALAEEAGADLILVTCSSIAPGVDVARTLVETPIMKVDEPMAEKAVLNYDRIGLMATAKSTFDPSTELVRAKAEELNREIELVPMLFADAFDCFFRGDMEEHDRILLEAAREMKGKVEVIILAQASMGHLKDRIAEITGVPVLTSPPLAMDALAERIKNL